TLNRVENTIGYAQKHGDCQPLNIRKHTQLSQGIRLLIIHIPFLSRIEVYNNWRVTLLHVAQLLLKVFRVISERIVCTVFLCNICFGRIKVTPEDNFTLLIGDNRRQGQTVSDRKYETDK